MYFRTVDGRLARGIRVPGTCVVRRGDGHFSLREEVLCPIPGWRQPLRCCGHPPSLLAQIAAGAAAGDLLWGWGHKVRAIDPATGHEVGLADFWEVWRVVEPAPDPADSLLEFQSWALPR